MGDFGDDRMGARVTMCFGQQRFCPSQSVHEWPPRLPKRAGAQIEGYCTSWQYSKCHGRRSLVQAIQLSGLATFRYCPAGRSLQPTNGRQQTPSPSTPPQRGQRHTPQETGCVSHSPENRTPETRPVRCECTALASGERQARKGDVVMPSAPRRPRVLQCEGR